MPAAPEGVLSPAGSGLELEESGKSRAKKLDAMTLIKEDMSIFGQCPAQDEFYLVVCSHCSQVVKPQAFQKHCERRHGPLGKLHTRATATKCHLNGTPVAGGTPGGGRAPGARGRVQPLPERTDKDSNLCLFVPVVNLEKIPSIPKPEGQGLKVPPQAVPTTSKEPLGKPATPTLPKAPPAAPGGGGDSAMPADHPVCKPQSAGEKEGGASKPPPRSHKKMARKECDLNRQCGVLNPDTNKICTRLLTCKIHSVHQRREVRGRAKDFDILVAELKANARRGDTPKDRSPPGKEYRPPPPPLPPPQQDPSELPQPLASPPSIAPPCRAKPPHCPLPRARLSSDSDPEDAPGEGGRGVFPFPPPTKGGNRVSSEESEEEGGCEEPPRPPTRPPRPQAFCTFGSRLVSPGCYVFNRRLDRFCSALGSMLDRHLSAHRWRKIPPAAEPPFPTPPLPPSPPAPPCSPPTWTPSSSSSSPHSVPPPGTREGRVPSSLSYTVGSPPAAAACSQPECGGGVSQSITSPLPAHTPSPSFSKLPPTKASSKSARARDPTPPATEPEPRKRKPPPPSGAPPYHKRTCSGDKTKPPHPSCQGLPTPPPQQNETHPSCASSSSSSSLAILNGTTRGTRPPPTPPDCRTPPASALHGPGGAPPPPPRCISEDEVRKRKNSATYCRPLKTTKVVSPPTPPPPPGPPPPNSGGSVRRKKPGPPLGFEEKRSVLKSKAH
ncbi:LOW QUALITY PROTEIN: ataxin-7-like protein 2 [Phaethornis superciliosus]